MRAHSWLVVGIVVITAAGAIWYWQKQKPTAPAVSSFEECVEAGYPVLESYPARCNTPDGQSFTQDIGNELEKQDLIRIDSPRPNQQISHTVTVAGEARGTWFFEATFPLHLEDANGTVIVTSFAEAQDEWMTESFVPFSGTLTIPPTFHGSATLVLEKANPSGLPDQTDELRVPVEVE